MNWFRSLLFHNVKIRKKYKILERGLTVKQSKPKACNSEVKFRFPSCLGKASFISNSIQAKGWRIFCALFHTNIKVLFLLLMGGILQM